MLLRKINTTGVDQQENRPENTGVVKRNEKGSTVLFVEKDVEICHVGLHSNSDTGHHILWS